MRIGIASLASAWNRIPGLTAQGGEENVLETGCSNHDRGILGTGLAPTHPTIVHASIRPSCVALSPPHSQTHSLQCPSLQNPQQMRNPEF
jgi:hypothetical protein